MAATPGNFLAFSDGGPASYPIPSSCWELIVKSVKAYPDNIAIATLHQPPDHLSELLEARSEQYKPGNHLEWSYKQLQSAAIGLAEALVAAKVQKGDVFVSFVSNSVEYAIINWAALCLNVTFAPLDSALLGRNEELQDIFNLLHPRVVAVNDSTAAQQIDKLNSDLLAKLVVVDGGDKSRVNWWHFPQFILSLASNLQPLETTKAEKTGADTYPVDIVFTSGTTSRPKACPQPVRVVNAAIIDRAITMGLESTSKFFISTANFRIICVRMGLVAWISGAKVVYPRPGAGSAEILKAIASERCSHMVFIPALVHEMARQRDLVDLLKDNDHIKYAGLGGDIVTAQVVEKARKILNAERVVPAFGMSEGSNSIGWSKARFATKNDPIPMAEGSVTGVGQSRPGTKIKVCQQGTRKPVKRGEKGALHVTGSIPHYLENRDAESFYEDAEGSWFITGDVAVMDHAGVIFVVGRMKDIIKRKGVTISPVAIESYFNRRPGILASVIGLPHEEYGQVPIAVIRTDEENHLSKNELKKQVNDELSPDSAVEDVISLKDLGLTEFPLNATAKIMRRELQQLVGEFYRQQQQQPNQKI